jgi:Xaa-Pro aminopeptidase
MNALVIEKVEQAVGLLQEMEIDAWLTFVRETTEAGDPVLPIILGQSLTWQSALIITRTGERIAIVGAYETEAVRATGAYTDVVEYVEGIREPLRAVLERLDPGRLAINYSMDDVKADGLTHGLYLLLLEHLAETPWVDRLESAGPLIGALRGRKTPGELQRIERAIETTDEIFKAVHAYADVGRAETEISAFMHEAAKSRGVGLAWDAAGCPIVTTGPNSMVGHGVPSADLRIEPGGVFHLDFGVQQDGYCSDVQRGWYVPGAGEAEPPADVQQAASAVVAAIKAAAEALRPGVQGWVVDDAARRTLVEAGYPEYRHATGHQVGRAAHDGGCVLGPRWARYGSTPFIHVEAGNVFTLELGVESLKERGYFGLEEMVLVTEDGCRWLTDPQVTVPLLGATSGRIC